MSRITPHIAFFIAYAGLLFLAGFAANKLGTEEATKVIPWVAPFFSAPLALLIAIRLGCIRSIGVAVTSAVLLLFICVSTVAILVAVAAPVVQVDLKYIAKAFVSVFALGGWELLWSCFIIVVAPLLWSTVLQEAAEQPPGRRPNNSFKPKPLRGSA